MGIEGEFFNIIKSLYEKAQHHTQWAKTKSFPTNIKNKTRMSPFTTPIHHTIGSPSHHSQTRKGNKRHPNWKGGSKTVIVCR